MLAGMILSLPLAAEAADPDPWFGEDKFLHFGVSATIPLGGYAAGSVLFEDAGPRLAVAAGSSLALGIGKELHDLTGRGSASLKDLAWDVGGTLVGTATMWLVDRLFVEPPRRRWKHERSLRQLRPLHELPLRTGQARVKALLQPPSGSPIDGSRSDVPRTFDPYAGVPTPSGAP